MNCPGHNLDFGLFVDRVCCNKKLITAEHYRQWCPLQWLGLLGSFIFPLLPPPDCQRSKTLQRQRLCCVTPKHILELQF